MRFSHCLREYREKKKDKNEKKHHCAVDKLPLLCEKPDAILIVLMGLTAGRLAGRYVAI